MNSALGPWSVIDQGCDAVTQQRTHAITSRLALPSSMFILVIYPVIPVCRMCTKICRLLIVSWLFFSFHAHTKQASLTFFPAAIDQWLRVAALCRDQLWSLQRPTVDQSKFRITMSYTLSKYSYSRFEWWPCYYIIKPLHLDGMIS